MRFRGKTARLVYKIFAAGVAAAAIIAVIPSQAQEIENTPAAGLVPHAECTYFGPDRERFTPHQLSGGSVSGHLTAQFQAAIAGHSPRTTRARPYLNLREVESNLIDSDINADFLANNVTPADKTTDYEFIRRATLDLTGRIPTAARVTTFVASADPNKRAALIDELLARPEWVDKWTMYFGDLFKNTAANTQVNIRPEGRNAFYKWIHDSVAAGKPYNKMATEIIAAQGNNSFDQTNGQINYLPLGVVTGGPAQDIFDSQTANVADVFLGLAHVNCLLCHNGRGHLDSLSLWASQTTRVQAWGLSAFMAHTWTRSLNLPPDPNNPNRGNYNYWSLDVYKTDYQLNTTTGNRPARQPIGTVKVITPSYIFTGATPAGSEDYRVALARNVTGDFQFARAAVNYQWAQFFGVGIVDPPDQFDPARLDPNKPPPAPWTLQPTNAKLLNDLAQYFIESNYDIKALQRLIVTSDTYQLASEYSGTYDPAWDKYFARKFVRRLWAEELHDSVVTAINALPSYTVPNFSNDSAIYDANSPGFGKISFAMQAPDVVNMPDGGGAVSQFLDTFLRGNRDDQPRKSEGSILQTLGLMNDNFIQSRIHATGTGSTATYLMNALTSLSSDTALVNKLFMDILSRPPNPDELTLALAELKTGASSSGAVTATQRKTNAEDLLWTLFNKVDFVFNY
jgi:hypothetical protein